MILQSVKDAGIEVAKKQGGDVEADAIKKEFEKLGLNADNVETEVDGDTVKLKGDVEDKTALEQILIAAGNVNGVSKVDVTDLLSNDGQTPDSDFHTVVRGDTLSGIAKKYYGDAMKYPQIFEANKPMLKDPNLIYPGQKLRIPKLV
jgi:nucleoid-associated protein YgaU